MGLPTGGLSYPSDECSQYPWLVRPPQAGTGSGGVGGRAAATAQPGNRWWVSLVREPTEGSMQGSAGNQWWDSRKFTQARLVPPYGKLQSPVDTVTVIQDITECLKAPASVGAQSLCLPVVSESLQSGEPAAGLPGLTGLTAGGHVWTSSWPGQPCLCPRGVGRRLLNSWVPPSLFFPTLHPSLPSFLPSTTKTRASASSHWPWSHSQAGEGKGCCLSV